MDKTATCRHCGEKIYLTLAVETAAPQRVSASTGWLHLASGERRCAGPVATPIWESIRLADLKRGASRARTRYS